ncbi:Sugar transporter ERD6-like 7 [Vigna angularis]|uniref:Sugar transporter ERD6-like 7 n=1 Tax=Phaseolus angularis TaxID=3914 RepID=A0A8T0L1U4_PHAAN|nr:Sugar transporter ERD6-like 7 [Vigna angularis]
MEIKVVEEGVQKGIREPLDHQLVHASKRHPWMLYFCTFVAVCGSYEFGTCAGYSSPTQDAIRKDFNLSLAEAMRVSSAFCVGGWLAIYFSEGPVPLDIGRLATGYGMGVFSYVVGYSSTLQKTTSCIRFRFRHLHAQNTNILPYVGWIVQVAFTIGNVLSWRALALIGESYLFKYSSNDVGLIPTSVLLLGLFIIPESPRWLAKRGRKKDFEAALQILRGKDADISEEAEEVQDYITTLEQLPKSRLLELFHRRYLRSVTIGIGLMVCQQFGGINAICFYASSIFELARFSPAIGTISYACLQLVVTGIGAVLIDKTGRKPLLLLSGTGVVAGCTILAVAFYLKVYEVGVAAVPALAVTGILVYIGSFGIGMGAIPWVVMSEIFPVNIKGQAGSLATLTNWFGAWLCSYTFNFLMSWSSYGTFILYAAINALAILFIIFAVPETKGKSLEQLQAAINS